MRISYAVYSTSGIYRPINEDNVYLNGIIKPKTRANYVYKGISCKKRQLFAVFDGMGGEQNGEDASYIASDVMKRYQDNFSDQYMKFIGDANKHICNSGVRPSSGCTLAALSIQDNCAFVVNLGDSRIYYFGDTGAEQLTKDHTEFSALVDYGVLKEEDYYTSKTRNHLTRHIGSNDPAVIASPFVKENIRCEVGDIFMLCTDGYCGVVPKDEIPFTIPNDVPLLTACVKMGKKAAQKGSDDNITVILVKILELER